MPLFQAGNSGKPRGAINKRTQAFIDRVESSGFDVAQALMEVYHEAKKTYDNYGTIYGALSEASEKSGNPFPVEDKQDRYLKIALEAAKEIASYCYPRLKAVEHTTHNPLSEMSPQEKLEAMKQAVLMLESEIKKNE